MRANGRTSEGRGVPRQFRWLLGVVVLVAIAAALDWRSIYETSKQIPLWCVLAWVGLTLITRGISAYTTFLPLTTLGGSVSFLQCFWLSCVRTFLNQVIPAAGATFSAVFFRFNARLTWSEVGSLALPLYLLAAVATGIVGLIATSLNISDLSTWSILPIVTFSILASSAYAVRVLEPLIASISGSKWSRFAGRAREVLNSVRRIWNAPYQIPRLIAAHCATVLLRAGRLWLLLAVLGAPIAPHQVMLLSALAEIAFLVQVTPGGLGIREGLLISLASLWGVSLEVAAAAAMVDRLLSYGMVAALAPIGFFALTRESAIARPSIGA